MSKSFALAVVLGSISSMALTAVSRGSSSYQAVQAPSIQINRSGGRTTLIFTGTLQSAPAVTGPWTDLPAASSPLLLDTLQPRAFYRSVASTGASIFASSEVVHLTVSGPLQQHFALAFAGLPDGIFPPKREKPPFEGAVIVEAQEIPATLKVRGFSSLQECPFPKLTLKVGKKDREGTPFSDAREIKIGTHCAEGGRGSIGRLRDERSTYREALAYEAMAELGFLSPRVRRAQIEFRDTSPTNQVPDGGWTITRNALLFDDAEVVGERLGGHALDDAELQALTNANLDPQLIADLRFLHILLGNWDYTLNTSGERLWNTDVIRLPDGSYLPMAGDFDLCSWVTEEVRPSVPWDYLPELPLLERQMRYDLEQLQGSLRTEVYASARGRFLAGQASLKTLVEKAVVDDAGRTNALNHLDTFFSVIETPAR